MSCFSDLCFLFAAWVDVLRRDLSLNLEFVVLGRLAGQGAPQDLPVPTDHSHRCTLLHHLTFT